MLQHGTPSGVVLFAQGRHHTPSELTDFTRDYFTVRSLDETPRTSSKDRVRKKKEGTKGISR
jgi:hypothetical protein